MENKKLYLFDLDGTLLLGDQVIDGAIEAINKIREAGKKFLIFTNNSSRTRKQYVEKLTKLGFNIKEDEIVTAGYITGKYLIKKNKKIPYYLKCNVDIFCIGLEKEKLYFLPDKILIIKNGNPGVIPYNDVKFEYTETNFIETDSVPSDTQIIKYTWKFVNKNGKPDKRYKNNKQIPICKYGEISITSNTGLNTVLLVSNSEKALEFVSMMKTIQQYIEEQENI